MSLLNSATWIDAEGWVNVRFENGTRYIGKGEWIFLDSVADAPRENEGLYWARQNDVGWVEAYQNHADLQASPYFTRGEELMSLRLPADTTLPDYLL